MKTINDLGDIVRQSQGKASEAGMGRLACLTSFLFAFAAFFRG